ncbi:MAG: hypothetical protein JO157_08035 [Acetobacteraceae bacterium]|nr:hypothetical protein [Acetobacteraceae bacterium]
MSRVLRSLLALLLWLGLALPAQAAVTITFWSHELGNSFPHAFITLRGVPDGGGAPVDANYGFTAKSVTPALLFGSVPGEVEPSKPAYIAGSDAQFSVVLTDAQYAQVLALIAAWDEKTGDGHYNLNKRNCIHFVKEAARIAGLTDLDRPQLMKRPRSYLQSIEAANEGRVIKVAMHGKAYLASLPPLGASAVAVSTDPAGADTPGHEIGARPIPGKAKSEPASAPN